MLKSKGLGGKEMNGDYLFRQVYEYVLHRIELNEWNENEKLPSIRNLAAEMKVHRLTVLKAYQLLKQEKESMSKINPAIMSNPVRLIN
jgi:DNA-binding transcriptional regulator YhcF (GntR family)